MSHMDTRMSWEPDKPHEECGVFGMYDLDGNDVASSIYYGLFALQHRGQESCGIAVSDTFGPRKVDLLKGMGLVNEVFNQENIASLKGNIGVGHCRYSTAGESIPSNAQPLVINYVKGTLMLAHNGNLINANELREELAYTGAIFQTTIDSEVIAYHIARERIKTKTAEQAVVVSSPRKLIGARDPYGFKPLCIGKRDNAYILASETCALDTIDAEFVRDVEPGEVVVIDKDGIKSDKSLCLKPEEQARCVFEYIYFARPDSNFDGTSVYHSRIMAGKFLAMDSPVDADIVVGVPESGNAAAMGYAMQSGIPYGTAFVKNAYVGRTFIQPTQEMRERGVRMKLSAVSSIVKGKRVIMIDDSIVRGTTSKRIVKLLKEAGATEVHVRIASPAIKFPCFYGVDISTLEELISHRMNVEELCQFIEADSLAFISMEGLKKSVKHDMDGSCDLCMSCFSGNYVTKLYDSIDRANKDEK